MSDRPPPWSVMGTLVGAPLFMGASIVYVPYALSGWRFAPPFLSWVGTRWIGAGLIVLAAPVLLDFLVGFVREGHGTHAGFRAYRGAEPARSAGFSVGRAWRERRRSVGGSS